MMSRWVRWYPENADVDPLAEAIGRNLGYDKFLMLFEHWNQIFPKKWVVSTATGNLSSTGLFDPDIVLRLWFGEPHSIESNHVDSMGHNLIVQIMSSAQTINQLSRSIHGEFNFSRENGASVWRRKS